MICLLTGAIIVCGGGERFWRPNAKCWQLLAGLTGQWELIPQMYPVHGAATAFFQSKFWVLGGKKKYTFYYKIQQTIMLYKTSKEGNKPETSCNIILLKKMNYIQTSKKHKL